MGRLKALPPKGWDPEGELGFRVPMVVAEMARYGSGDTYPLCPRCRVPLDREYQQFCDRCGQRLGWSGYGRALAAVRL